MVLPPEQGIYDYYARGEAWTLSPGAVESLQRIREAGALHCVCCACCAVHAVHVGRQMRGGALALCRRWGADGGLLLRPARSRQEELRPQLFGSLWAVGAVLKCM